MATAYLYRSAVTVVRVAEVLGLPEERWRRYRYVAGLRPASPGYRTFDVRPRPGGGITSATARHISPFGPIEVSWRREGRSMELDVLVPPGTTATVTLPGEAPCDAAPGRHRWTSAPPPG